MAKAAIQQPWSLNGGATNFTRNEAQRFARQIVQSQTYRDTIEDRVKSKTLPPAIESLLWYYAYGKPMEQINLNVTDKRDLSSLSITELQEELKRVGEELEEAEALEGAIPGVVVPFPQGQGGQKP